MIVTALLLMLAADSAGAAPAREVARRLSPTDTVLVLPEVRVDRERALLEARRRLPTAFVTEIAVHSRARAIETLDDVLSGVVGTHVDRYGGLGAFSTVSLRGAPAGQVAVYLDGVPLTSAAHGVVSLSDLPVTAIDRVEVYRGVTPPSFGMATPGGAINLVTVATPGLRELRVARGAFDTWEALGTAGARRGPLALLLHAGYQGSAGDFRYFDDNGTPFNTADDSVLARANNRFDAVAGLATLTWTPRPGWTALAREDLFRKAQGSPGVGAVATRTARLELLRSLTHLELASHSAGWIPGVTLTASLDDERTRDHDPRGELGYGRHETDDALWSRLLSLELEWRDLLPWLSVGGGGRLRGEIQRQRDAADGWPDPPLSRRLTRGATLSARIHPFGGRVVLHGATRWERLEDELHTVGVGGVESVNEVARILDAPQAGIRLTAPFGLDARANWTRAARAPGFEELFGRAGSILGNPALLPERGENWDAGLGWERALTRRFHVVAEWAHFESETRDLIVYTRVFQNVKPQNLARAEIAGEELSARLLTPGGLALSGALTWQRAINRAPVPFWYGRRLPLRPARQGSLRLEWHGGGFAAAGDLQYIGDNDLDPANRTRVASRTLAGASLSAPLIRQALHVTLDGRNLGDNRVADVAGYPLPGRSVFLSLDLHGGGDAANR